MFQRALSLDAAEQTDEAVRTMQPLIEARDNPRYLLAYAFFMSRVNRDDEAIQAIRDALTITPAYCEGEARLLLADLLLRSGAKGDAIAQWHLSALPVVSNPRGTLLGLQVLDRSWKAGPR